MENPQNILETWIIRAKSHKVTALIIFIFVVVIGIGNFTDAIEKINSFLEKHPFFSVANSKSKESQEDKKSVTLSDSSEEIKYSDGTNQALKIDCSKAVCLGSPEATINHINHYISVKAPDNTNDRKKLIARWLAKYKEASEELRKASSRAQGEEAATALSLGHIEIAAKLIDELINNREYGGGTAYDAWLHKIKGDLLWLQSNNEDAAASYRKAVDINRTYRDQYAEVLEEIGRRDEAEIIRRTQQAHEK